MRDAILSCRDFRTEPVEVPEWDMTVHVRSVDGHGRSALLRLVASATAAGGTEADFVAVLPAIVSLMACDQDGVLLFGPNDIEALGRKSPFALDRLALAGLKLNGLDTGADKAAKKNPCE